MNEPASKPVNVTPASLQQTLLEYQAILENASVGILLTRDRRVLHCNPKYSEIFGWPHGELVGQPGSVFYLSAEDYAEIGRIATPILSSGQVLDRELLMRRKDGSAFHCHMWAKAIDPRNTTAGTIWIAEDISERKRAQAELQELLLRQQAILENASIGIVFTRNGVVVHCNPRMEAIYGWPTGSLTGQQGSVFFKDEQDYARFGQAYGHRLAAGELIDVEWLNARRDGTLFCCRHLAKALPTTDGSRSTIWISEDITAKKAAEEALTRAHRELEQRVGERTAELATVNEELETIIRSAPLAIYTRALNSIVTSWNPAAEQMFGWKAEEIIGHPVPTISTARQTEADDLLRRVLRGDPIVQFETQRQKRDGTPIDISLTAAPLRDSAGQLHGYLTIAADITERKAAKQQIEFLAYHDLLTGLPNRLLMQDRYEQAAAQAERSKTKVALLFLDLDNFKNINDSLGHAMGDVMLKEVASRLRHSIRDTDTICRQGGDEFLIVLRDLPDADTIGPILLQLMERVQEPIPADGQELSTSVSVGVALFPEDGRDFETLLQRADMAMYRAKEAGRNTYHFFNEEMSAEATEHLLMRNGLRRALERGEFELYYQPQIDLANGEVVGAEALLRWNHPDFGQLLPSRFIPVAEGSGLIVPIGEWVIHEACRQAMAWQKSGLPPLPLAINLSAVQFRRGSVEQTVIQALKTSGLDPACLELELTESILVQNVEQVLATVKRLKQLGVKLSIDDFGTGYSSLSYLRRFDVDKLKIDQSFVSELASNPDDAAIVRAVIQMAHSLNVKTIAEGVETDSVAQLLRRLQCDEAQGYHFARPMPAADFARFLAARKN